MSKKVVVFTESGAKLVNKRVLLPFYDKSKVIVDPDISHLKEVAQIFWTLKDHRIEEMTRPEKIEALASIKEKNHREPLHKTIYPFRVKLLYFIITVVFLAAFLFRFKTT